jgi:hypothetical protein
VRSTPMQIVILMLFVAFCVSLIVLLPYSANSRPAFNDARPSTAQTTCFKTGESRDGRYKICYYSCLGSTVATTIRVHELCPLTIQR